MALGRRLWFHVRWALQRAASDGAADFPQKQVMRERETETVLPMLYNRLPPNSKEQSFSHQESGQGLGGTSGSASLKRLQSRCQLGLI